MEGNNTNKVRVVIIGNPQRGLLKLASEDSSVVVISEEEGVELGLIEPEDVYPDFTIQPLLAEDLVEVIQRKKEVFIKPKEQLVKSVLTKAMDSIYYKIRPPPTTVPHLIRTLSIYYEAI